MELREAYYREGVSEMTNEEIHWIAKLQSAIDCNCAPEDFDRDEHVFTISRPHPQARKYLPLPLGCDLVSYGRNVVAQTSEECAGAVRKYLSRVDTAHCMQTPGIHILPAWVSLTASTLEYLEKMNG